MTQQPEVVKYHQLDAIFPDSQELKIIRSLISAHCIVKGGDGYQVETIRTEVERYKDRLVAQIDLTAQTGLSLDRVSEALLDAERVGRMIDDISQKSRKRLYCLREGISLDELAAYVGKYSERIEELKGETVSLGAIREEVAIPLARFSRLLDAGMRDKYLIPAGKRATGGREGARYRIKPGKTREEFIGELGVLKESYFSNELAAALGLPAFKVSELMTPELEAQYLEVMVGKGKYRMWRVRPETDLDGLYQALEAREQKLLHIREATANGRKVQRLMHLQSRYDDLKYAAKIELALRGDPELKPDHKHPLQHLMLDELVSTLYENMPSARREEIISEIRKKYGVDLIVKGGEAVEPDAEGTEDTVPIFDLPYFTQHHLSGLLGLNSFRVKTMLSQRFKDGVITTVGGSARMPKYRLKKGIDREEFVERLLQEYESYDTRMVLTTTTEGKGENRVLYLKDRYPQDNLFHAKVDLCLRSYTPVIISKGWKRMQAMEHQGLDRRLRILFAHLDRETAEKLLHGVLDDFGVDLTDLVKEYIGTDIGKEFEPIETGQQLFSSTATKTYSSPSGAVGKGRKKSPRKNEPKEKASDSPGKRPTGRKGGHKKTREPPPLQEAPTSKKLTGNAAWLALGDDDDDNDPANDPDWKDDEGDY